MSDRRGNRVLETSSPRVKLNRAEGGTRNDTSANRARFSTLSLCRIFWPTLDETGVIGLLLSSRLLLLKRNTRGSVYIYIGIHKGGGLTR